MQGRASVDCARVSPAAARVLVCDELSPEATEILERAGLAVETRLGLREPELTLAARGVHALLVRSATRITRGVIAAAPQLRVVGRAGVGVDNIDCEAATEHGVLVLNAPEGNTTTTAELALALLFALARRIPRADALVRSGGWSKSGLVGLELTGKTLGVVGLGRIGRALAQRARGLQMEVLASDPFLPPGSRAPEGVSLVELEELLARAHFVSLHTPLTPATHHLIDAARLASMRPGALLVNAARGGLVDEAALLAALESGHLGGAALDVYEQEPPPQAHPLYARADVVLTPHLGASSREAQRSVAIEVAQQVAEFLSDGLAPHALNAPTADRETLRAAAPRARLAESLGALLAQLCRAPLERLELRARAPSAQLRLIGAGALIGALRAIAGRPINFVNAERIARERGLALELAGEPLEAQAELELVAHPRAGASAHSAAGAFLGGAPRIVRIDATPLVLEPGGLLLATRHADQPGVVGRIGTLLGAAGLNIRRIELGPVGPAAAREAAGYWSLEAPVPTEVVERIAALDSIHAAGLLQL